MVYMAILYVLIALMRPAQAILLYVVGRVRSSCVSEVGDNDDMAASLVFGGRSCLEVVALQKRTVRIQEFQPHSVDT